MKRVVLESPLGGNFARNIKYARLCMIDCLRRKEAPYASHLLMTQFLDDASPEERDVGMQVGFLWGAQGELAAVYEDLGVSGGMQRGIDLHVKNGIPVERRKLPADLMAQLDGVTTAIHATFGIGTKSDPIEVKPIPDTCPNCNEKYVHIEHPMKPGVSMMATCGCKYRSVQSGTTTFVILEPPK